MKDNEEIEILDFELEPEKKGTKKKEKKQEVKKTKKVVKKRVVKQKVFLFTLLMTLLVLTSFVTVQYFIGLDVFSIYKEKKIEINNIKEAYTTSKNGRNLTLYEDGTFKYMDLEKIKEGTYQIENNKYTLIYDSSICELNKINDILLSNCSLVMLAEDNDYMMSKNKRISKVLHSINSDEYNKISTAFLTYVNGLPTLEKYPTLKASRVDSINDCFTGNNFKTFTCSINYTVIPNEKNIEKSKWLSNGKVVKGAIKRFNYVTFTNTKNVYKFSKMVSNL